MRIDIKPLSVNEAWQGRRFKTPKYKNYERSVLLMLKPCKIDLEAHLRVFLTFGYSNTLCDIDNGLKPFIDILQKYYKINDRKIYELVVKKEIVKKGKEFIEFKIEDI